MTFKEHGTIIMRAVCAWCKKIIREGPEPTTHSLCLACEEGLSAQTKLLFAAK